MFNFCDMTGVRTDLTYINKLSIEKKQIVDIYLKLCESIINEDIEELRSLIPQIYIKQNIGGKLSCEEWFDKIQKQIIKYYGIEILKISINIKDNMATIKTTNKIRAKLYDYRGSWTVDSYLILENKENNWIIKDFFI